MFESPRLHNFRMLANTANILKIKDEDITSTVFVGAWACAGCKLELIPMGGAGQAWRGYPHAGQFIQLKPDSYLICCRTEIQDSLMSDWQNEVYAFSSYADTPPSAFSFSMMRNQEKRIFRAEAIIGGIGATLISTPFPARESGYLFMRAHSTAPGGAINIVFSISDYSIVGGANIFILEEITVDPVASVREMAIGTLAYVTEGMMLQVKAKKNAATVPVVDFQIGILR